jgi:hypothetical protein
VKRTVARTRSVAVAGAVCDFVDVEGKHRRRVAGHLPVDRAGNQLDELGDRLDRNHLQIGRVEGQGRGLDQGQDIANVACHRHS